MEKNRIPEQLSSHLIKLCPTDCDCDDPGRNTFHHTTMLRRLYSRENEEIQRWVNQRNNIGRSLDDDIVVVDVNNEHMDKYVKTYLPSTFTVGIGERYYMYYQNEHWSGNATFVQDEMVAGSIQSNGYTVVPPSTRQDGTNYRIVDGRDIISIESSVLIDLYLEFGSQKSIQQQVNDTDTRYKTPVEHPDLDVSPDVIYESFFSDEDKGRLEATNDIDQSVHDFLLCRHMAEGGFSVDSIVETMNSHRHPEADWHTRDIESRRQIARNSIKMVYTDFFDFDTTPPVEASEAEQPDTPVSPPRPPEELPRRPPPPPDSLESPPDKGETDPHTTIPGVQTPLDDPDTDPPANAITDGESELDLQRTKPFFEDAPTAAEVAESFQNSTRPSPDNNGWDQSSPDPETTTTPQSQSSPPPNSSETTTTRETSGQPTPSDTDTHGHLLTAIVVKLLVLPAQLIAYLWVPWMLLGCYALVEILAGDTAAVATVIPDALPTQTTPQLFLSTVFLGFVIPVVAILIDLRVTNRS